MSTRIGELENENIAVKGRLTQLHASSPANSAREMLDTSSSSSGVVTKRNLDDHLVKLEADRAAERNQLDNDLDKLKKEMASTNAAATSMADREATGKGSRSVSPAAGTKLSMKQSFLQAAEELGTAAASVNLAASKRMVTPPNALPALGMGMETPYFTPHAVDASTPIDAPSKSPMAWDPDEVKAWMTTMINQRQLGYQLFADGATGSDLFELQFHDLVSYGVQTVADAENILIKITELLVADPIASALPVQQWSFFHVRRWLLRQGLGHRCGVFQQGAVDGVALCQLRELDLRDLGVTDADDVSMILSFTEQNGGLSQTAPGRGWSGHAEHSTAELKVTQWAVSDVMAWLKKTHRSRYVKRMQESEVDGMALLAMQAGDLMALGLKDAFEVKRFLLDVTLLIVKDPVDIGVPMKAWTTWQVRFWLLRNAFVDELQTFQKLQTTGIKLLGYTHHDLIDIGLQDESEIFKFLGMVSSAAREPIPPGRGSVDWDRITKLRRPAAKMALFQTRR